MTDYNFTTMTAARDDHAARRWEHQEGFARQLLYDLVESATAATDTVVRHQDLDDWHKRYATGVKVALVHLVGQLDAVINRSFRSLWRLRRERLHAWVKHQLGKGEDPLRFELDFEKLWLPNTQHVALQDYFRARVFKTWDKKMLSRRLKAIERILLTDAEESEVEEREEVARAKAAGLGSRLVAEGLKHLTPEEKRAHDDLERRAERVRKRIERREARLQNVESSVKKPKRSQRRGGIPVDALNVLDGAVQVRNGFPHPDLHDDQNFPRVLPGETPRDQPPSVGPQWFQEVLCAFRTVVLWIERRTHQVIGYGWIATNIKYLSRSLTDEQQAIFNHFTRNSGDSYTTLPELFSAIDHQKTGFNGPPKLVVISTTQEVMHNMTAVETFMKANAETKVIFYENEYDPAKNNTPIMLTREEREKLTEMDEKNPKQVHFIASHEYGPPTRRWSGGLYEEGYDSKDVLQRMITAITRPKSQGKKKRRDGEDEDF